MDREKVLHLATLARIRISAEEADRLGKEIESILKYVDEIRKVEKVLPAGRQVDKVHAFDKEEFPVRNVMREDSEGHEPDMYTEKILAQAPERKGEYLKVKKIL